MFWCQFFCRHVLDISDNMYSMNTFYVIIFYLHYRKLSLSTNMIEKITGISSLKNLKILSLGRNYIKNFSGLVTTILSLLLTSFIYIERFKSRWTLIFTDLHCIFKYWVISPACDIKSPISGLERFKTIMNGRISFNMGRVYSFPHLPLCTRLRLPPLLHVFIAWCSFH